MLMPAASAINLLNLHEQFYHWVLRRGPRPAFLEQRVGYFVLGAEPQRWQYAESVEAIASRRCQLQLSSPCGRGATSVADCGLMKEGDAPPAGDAPDEYIYDPLDTRAVGTDSVPEVGHLNDTMTSIRPSSGFGQRLETASGAHWEIPF
jgi:hypothetical protein